MGVTVLLLLTLKGRDNELCIRSEMLKQTEMCPFDGVIWSSFTSTHSNEARNGAMTIVSPTQ